MGKLDKRKVATPPWIVLGISIVAAAAILVVVSALGSSDDVRATRSTTFADSIAVLMDESSTDAAAVVNGEVIPLAKVNAFAVLLDAGGAFDEIEAPVASPEEYLDLLVTQELLYQEAVRRGLSPSDTEVLAHARQVQHGLFEVMASDTEAAEALRTTFASVEGTPYHVDAYDSSEVMLEGFRQQIAVNAIREELLTEAGLTSPEDRVDRDAVEGVIDEFVATLRAEASIEIAVEFD